MERLPLNMFAKRGFANLCSLAFPVGCYALIHLAGQTSVSVSRFLGQHFLLIWGAAMVITASMRAVADRFLRCKLNNQYYGVIEWFILAIFVQLVI